MFQTESIDVIILIVVELFIISLSPYQTDP